MTWAWLICKRFIHSQSILFASKTAPSSSTAIAQFRHRIKKQEFDRAWHLYSKLRPGEIHDKELLEIWKSVTSSSNISNSQGKSRKLTPSFVQSFGRELGARKLLSNLQMIEWFMMTPNNQSHIASMLRKLTDKNRKNELSDDVFNRVLRYIQVSPSPLLSHRIVVHLWRQREQFLPPDSNARAHDEIVMESLTFLIKSRDVNWSEYVKICREISDRTPSTLVLTQMMDIHIQLGDIPSSLELLKKLGSKNALQEVCPLLTLMIEKSYDDRLVLSIWFDAVAAHSSCFSSKELENTVKAAISRERWDICKNLLSYLTQNHERIPPHSLIKIVNTMALVGNPSAAHRFAVFLIKNNVMDAKSTLAQYVFTSVMNGYVKLTDETMTSAVREQKVLEVFRDAIDLKIEPNISILLVLMDAFSRSGNMYMFSHFWKLATKNTVLEAIVQAETRSPAPDETLYRNALQSCVLEFNSEILSSKLRKNHHVRRSLQILVNVGIDSLGFNGPVHELTAFYDSFKNLAVTIPCFQSNLNHYNSFVEAFSRHRLYEDAWRVLVDAEMAGRETGRWSISRKTVSSLLTLLWSRDRKLFHLYNERVQERWPHLAAQLTNDDSKLVL